MDKEENKKIEGISIIIPCLNEENYVGIVLACLARQTFQNFEALVIDGLSEDKTQAAVDRAIEMYPELKGKVRFLSADKKGVAYQRNYGARAAIYNRLMFFDADVQIPNTFLSFLLKEVEKHDLDVATTVFEPISERVDDRVLYFIGNLYIMVKQFFLPVAMGFCIFSTKKIHEAIGGFDETIKVGEDFDYVERASKAGAKFRVLIRERAYVSIRRLKKEGRFTYYKKALLSQLLEVVKDKKEIAAAMEYEFGNYDQAAK